MNLLCFLKFYSNYYVVCYEMQYWRKMNWKYHLKILLHISLWDQYRLIYLSRNFLQCHALWMRILAQIYRFSSLVKASITCYISFIQISQIAQDDNKNIDESRWWFLHVHAAVSIVRARFFFMVQFLHLIRSITFENLETPTPCLLPYQL